MPTDAESAARAFEEAMIPYQPTIDMLRADYTRWLNERALRPRPSEEPTA